MMQGRFSRFEDRIQHLIEGGLARLLAGRLHPRDVIARLFRAMEDHAAPGPDGTLHAPERYTVLLNPADRNAILALHPDFETALAEEIVEMAHTAALTISDMPQVNLYADVALPLSALTVLVHEQTAPREPTASQTQSGLSRGALLEASTMPDAVLILNAGRHIPLDRNVLSIGRHRDNHIVLDDLRISRHHAQIRYRFDHYMVFDLNSRAGVLVNNQRVQEAVLRSGDVIRLAEHSLIFVLGDEPLTDDQENTRPLR